MPPTKHLLVSANVQLSEQKELERQDENKTKLEQYCQSLMKIIVALLLYAVVKDSPVIPSRS